MEDSKSLAERGTYRIYYLNGVAFLPHYNQNCYIRPGYGFEHWNSYHEFDLICLGAESRIESLWTRANIEEVKA